MQRHGDRSGGCNGLNSFLNYFLFDLGFRPEGPLFIPTRRFVQYVSPKLPHKAEIVTVKLLPCGHLNAATRGSKWWLQWVTFIFKLYSNILFSVFRVLKRKDLLVQTWNCPDLVVLENSMSYGTQNHDLVRFLPTHLVYSHGF